MRVPFLTLLATLFAVSYAAPPASFSSHDINTTNERRTNHALVRRAGLVPHVDPTAVDISPNGVAGAYPRVTSLSDGTLLGSYTAFSGSTRILTVSQSTDGGKTFTALGEIARSTGDLDNTFLLQLANGDVVAAFRNHDLDANGNPTFYRITTSISHDKGKTWVFLSQVNQRAATATKNGLWEPFMRLSKRDGSLQAYYASENADNDQDILMQSSTNNGQTWSSPITVAGGTTTGRDGMPGCANFNDGASKLMCVFETTEGRGTFQVKSVVSTDEGATWGQRSLVHAPAASNANAGAPQIVQTTDNNLVVSFMTDEDSSSHNWPSQFVSFKIVTGGPVATGNWGHETTVTTPQSSWPGLLAKSDGTVLACVGHDPEGSVCHTVTFTTS
ncbi:glycoside hydrolase family 93 protein [Lentinus tigrinus ALCF2SS1-7]|uniref:Glycoside hydrolase family 93 protein n=1 Tax=Lentinus tigrinus ALCF2SS1-6 TaxID=1328759 RepID=A0A5C2SSI7_9APHY|nr:glycoside hydrolase family 93 protein [Lentinus tigrinus ALCF2SS1-6]RPD80260.1 glycoside hydrolase family 93 protein [Lentinus tigrinus ALCF2SS1-7]